MEQLKNITEFVVVSNLENRALNAGIGKAQNWWKNRHSGSESNKADQIPQAQTGSSPLGPISGQLLVTVLRAQDLHESRLSMIAASAAASDRPYVVIECNQQRFQTNQADANSNNRNAHWSSNNGPFGFNIFNPHADRLTIWVQQQDSLRVMKRGEPKMIGTGEINVIQLLGQQQVWVPLRKDNKPVGQVLLQINFISHNDPPPPYNTI